MRPIKFRAFCSATKQMINLYCELKPNGRFWGEDMTNTPYDVKPDDIMQFTGLLDKDNKEIFEGDIIEADGFNPSKYLIEFIEGGFCATGKNCSPIDINVFYPSNGCQIKVVGNNCETPIF